MFEIKNLTKQYGNDFALKDVSITINKGMNFIVGASGSGKSSLLKIIGAMDKDYTGEVLFNKKSIKELSDDERSNYYHNYFGFIWQEFNLIDDLSVIENIKLPLYLNHEVNDKQIDKVIKRLKIDQLINQKVKLLSGGQKQRVAIAKELLKNPSVIIADEPTGALDNESTKIIMDLLYELAKDKMVIIVTHNESLVDKKYNVIELDKGEIISTNNNITIKDKKIVNKDIKSNLSLNNAFNIAKINCKNKLGRFSISVVTIILTAVFLLISMSGTISDANEVIFDDLIDTYGSSLLDVSIVSSFMSASGGDEDSPNADVQQDIGGLYDKYAQDERIEYILLSQPVKDLNVTYNGKDFAINSSNNVPVLNDLVAGSVPNGEANEVVVPESFAKMIGLSNEEIIGKQITIKGIIYNWKTGNPVEMNVETTVTVVGVGNTDIYFDSPDGVRTVVLEDSFFFSKSALFEMRSQANIDQDSASIVLRAKSPSDMISIKDDLLAEGIVPLGRFEMIEDIVRLQQQSTQQSGSSLVLIAILAVMLSIIITLITAIMRRYEYAVYKISGYNKSQLIKLTLSEYTLIASCSMLIFIICLPIINKATNALVQVSILNTKSIIIGIAAILLTTLFSSAISAYIAITTKEVKSLKIGGAQ